MRKTCRAGSPCNILLIEDDPAIAELLRQSATMYEPGCFNLEHALTLEQLAVKFSGIIYDLVIVDLGLTSSTGIATLKSARNLIDGRAPIAVLTGTDDEDMEIRCFEEGAIAYVVKPIVSPNQFLRRCRGWILKFRRDAEVRRRDIEIHDLLLRERDELHEARRMLSEMQSVQHERDDAALAGAQARIDERLTSPAQVAATITQVAEQLYAAARSIGTRYTGQLGQN